MDKVPEVGKYNQGQKMFFLTVAIFGEDGGMKRANQAQNYLDLKSIPCYRSPTKKQVISD